MIVDIKTIQDETIKRREKSALVSMKAKSYSQRMRSGKPFIPKFMLLRCKRYEEIKDVIKLRVNLYSKHSENKNIVPINVSDTRM